jgi:hypothetical protein
MYNKHSNNPARENAVEPFRFVESDAKYIFNVIK